MTETDKRKVFQRVKQMTVKTFWTWFDRMHSRAYALAVKHMTEAMSMHPRISRTMVDEVLQKAREIREEWDGIKEVTVSDTEAVEYDKVMSGGKQK